MYLNHINFLLSNNCQQVSFVLNFVLQSKALIRLQSAIDPETQRRCLTCYLLPQQRMDPVDSYGADADNQSFHPSLWEEQRQQRVQIQFQDNEPHEANHVRLIFI